MAGVVHDIRVAIRLLVRDRWMSLAAVTALALGLAANNTVFTIVNGLLLRDLPFEDPDRIVTIGMAPAGSPRPNAGVSLPDLVDWRIETKAFDGFGAATESTMNVADEHGAPQRLIGAHISAGAFRLLGRAPLSAATSRQRTIASGQIRSSFSDTACGKTATWPIPESLAARFE